MNIGLTSFFVLACSWPFSYRYSVFFPYARESRGMARTIRNGKLDTRSARSRLRLRREPYWTVISEGCALGYRRGAKGGTWIGRFRDETGRQHYEALGAADDARDPDGLSVFSFGQAQEKGRAFFARKAREIAGDAAPRKALTGLLMRSMTTSRAMPSVARGFRPHCRRQTFTFALPSGRFRSLS